MWSQKQQLISNVSKYKIICISNKRKQPTYTIMIYDEQCDIEMCGHIQVSSCQDKLQAEIG